MVNVLIVDDSNTDRLLTGRLLSKVPETTGRRIHESFELSYAADGDEALEKIRQKKPDLVVTDLIMPGKSGLELVKAIRHESPGIPVVLMTGQGSEDIAYQALQQGAAGYVPKRYLAQDLLETVQSVIEVSRAQTGKQRVLRCLMQTDAHFVLENDLSLVGPLVGHLEEILDVMNFCDEGERIRVGIALREAVRNAICHGNLELTADDAEHDGESYLALVNDRRHRDPYQYRRVHVIAQNKRTEVLYRVRNEGPGFDSTEFPSEPDPEKMSEHRGRGLLLIHTFMDQVSFNVAGTEITMIKRKPM